MICIASTHRCVSIFQSLSTTQFLLLMKSRSHLSQWHLDLNLAVRYEINNKNIYTRIVHTRGCHLKEETKQKIIKKQNTAKMKMARSTQRDRGVIRDRCIHYRGYCRFSLVVYVQRQYTAIVLGLEIQTIVVPLRNGLSGSAVREFKVIGKKQLTGNYFTIKTRFYKVFDIHQLFFFLKL